MHDKYQSIYLILLCPLKHSTLLYGQKEGIVKNKNENWIFIFCLSLLITFFQNRKSWFN